MRGQNDYIAISPSQVLQCGKIDTRRMPVQEKQSSHILPDIDSLPVCSEPVGEIDSPAGKKKLLKIMNGGTTAPEQLTVTSADMCWYGGSEALRPCRSA